MNSTQGIVYRVVRDKLTRYVRVSFTLCRRYCGDRTNDLISRCARRVEGDFNGVVHKRCI